MPNRKNVTWRVGEHPEHEKLNEWLDKQRNIQDSLTNIVLHMIDRFGMVNITDYEIQKQLYKEVEGTVQPSSEQEIKEVKQDVHVKEKQQDNNEAPKEEKDDDIDDLYKEVDINNL